MPPGKIPAHATAIQPTGSNTATNRVSPLLPCSATGLGGPTLMKSFPRPRRLSLQAPTQQPNNESARQPSECELKAMSFPSLMRIRHWPIFMHSSSEQSGRPSSVKNKHDSANKCAKNRSASKRQRKLSIRRNANEWSSNRHCKRHLRNEPLRSKRLLLSKRPVLRRPWQILRDDMLRRSSAKRPRWSV